MDEKLNKRIYSYVSPSELKQLKLEASAREISLAKCIRDSLLEYNELKKELAHTFEGLSDPETPKKIIHTLLAQTEVTLAASIDRQAEETQKLSQKIDRFILRYLLDTCTKQNEPDDEIKDKIKERYNYIAGE